MREKSKFSERCNAQYFSDDCFKCDKSKIRYVMDKILKGFQMC